MAEIIKIHDAARGPHDVLIVCGFPLSRGRYDCVDFHTQRMNMRLLSFLLVRRQLSIHGFCWSTTLCKPSCSLQRVVSSSILTRSFLGSHERID